MKELSIEEKARRYDKAIEIAKDINNEQRAQPANVMTRVFPELKKRDDVRIELLNYLYDVHDDDEDRARWIAWLEKQSSDISLFSNEQQKYMEKYVSLDKITLIKLLAERDANNAEIIESFEKPGEHVNFLSKIQIGDKVTRNEDGMLVNLSQLNRIAKPAENQGEQKLTPTLDIEIPFGAKDSELQKASYHIPEGFHAEIEGNRVVIKRGKQKPVGFNIGDEITVNGQLCRVVAVDKLAWSEEDKETLDYIIDYIEKNKSKDTIYTKRTEVLEGMVDWLKSIKERVMLQPLKEWSEEDRDLIEEIISHYRHLIAIESLDSEHYKSYIIPKLKLLKLQNRWKPSEQQMKALYASIPKAEYLSDREILLDSLYKDLKAL